MAIKPIVRAKGVDQSEPKLVWRFVARIWIWPLAAAAAETPRKKGVMMLAKLKMRVHMRIAGLSFLRPCVRKTKAAPRNTLPIKARVSGRKRTMQIAPKAEGNAEN